MSLQSLGTDCCVLATTCYPAAGGCLDPFWQVLPCAAVASGACVPGTCNAGADWRGALVMSHVSSSQWSWALHNALRSRAVILIHTHLLQPFFAFNLFILINTGILLQIKTTTLRYICWKQNKSHWNSIAKVFNTSISIPGHLAFTVW